MDIDTFTEYLKLHKLSLEQDQEKLDYVNEHHFYLVKNAEISLCEHLLGVINEQ